jgi:GNAT superfamily N-acetyltransferase
MGQDADDIARLLATVRTESVPDLPLAGQSTEAVTPFVRQVLLDEFEVWIAEAGGHPVGFMALMPPDHIAHLYIAAGHRGKGLGARFVDLARRRFPAGLQLWTFQENDEAQRFYEREGFVPVEWADDRDEDRASPDLRMAWRPGTGRA